MALWRTSGVENGAALSDSGHKALSTSAMQPKTEKRAFVLLPT
jgi:hypothetical protein